MHRKGFLGAVAGAALALFMAFGPVAASAAGDADVVVFRTGRANATVCWVQNNCGSALTYNFTTSGNTCLGASIDGTSDEELPSGVNQNNCQIDSTGTFVNVVCGTGLVAGDTGNSPYHTVIQESENGTLTPAYGVNGYTIVFAGGVGVVATTNVVDLSDGGTGVGAGVVNIVPADSNPAIGPFETAPSKSSVCTDGFSVNAVLATNA